jgi:hypothetical protein
VLIARAGIPGRCRQSHRGHREGRDSESGEFDFSICPAVQVKMVGVRLILIGSRSMQICGQAARGALTLIAKMARDLRQRHRVQNPV